MDRVRDARCTEKRGSSRSRAARVRAISYKTRLSGSSTSTHARFLSSLHFRKFYIFFFMSFSTLTSYDYEVAALMWVETQLHQQFALLNSIINPHSIQCMGNVKSVKLSIQTQFRVERVDYMSVIWRSSDSMRGVICVSSYTNSTHQNKIVEFVVQHSNKFLAGIIMLWQCFSVLSTLVVICIVITNFSYIFFSFFIIIK